MTCNHLEFNTYAAVSCDKSLRIRIAEYPFNQCNVHRFITSTKCYYRRYVQIAIFELTTKTDNGSIFILHIYSIQGTDHILIALFKDIIIFVINGQHFQ